MNYFKIHKYLMYELYGINEIKNNNYKMQVLPTPLGVQTIELLKTKSIEHINVVDYISAKLRDKSITQQDW